jgi:hypothetical protein
LTVLLVLNASVVEGGMFRVSWRDDDQGGTEVFESEGAAEAAARRIEGVALLHREPSGSVTVFRGGKELEEADAAMAFEEFMAGPVIEILRTRAAEADINIDPGDQTGAGWRAGTPEAFGWRVVRRTGTGPDAGVVILRPEEGTLPTPRAAEEEARRALANDRALADLPVIHTYR